MSLLDCTECGGKVLTKAKFCPHCGWPILCIITLISILEKLSNDNCDYVRMGLAENQITPPLTLEKLSDDIESEIRRSVAQNPNTPISILEKLSNDNVREVRMNVASNSFINRHLS